MIRVRFLALRGRVRRRSRPSRPTRPTGPRSRARSCSRPTRPSPKREALNVTQDKDHCLVEGRHPRRVGDRQPEEPRRQERRRVAAAGRQGPEGEVHRRSKIHPDDAKRKPAEHVIDQPCCMFVGADHARPRRRHDRGEEPGPGAAQLLLDVAATTARTTRPSRRWRSRSCPNPLVAESPPIQYKCTIHGVDDRLRADLRPPVLRGHRRGREVRDQERAGRQVPDRVLARERVPGRRRRAGSATRSRSRGRPRT